jgi:phosphoglycerate dehydrogenase-like enzyme
VLPGVADAVDSHCVALGPGSAREPFFDIESAEGIVAGDLVYDAAVMDLAPRLQVIARTGIGFDKVDLAAATKRGINVCNTPSGPTLSTAEHTMTLILMVAKSVKQSERRLAAGEEGLYARHDAIELDEKMLGLVGFGRIARRVAGAAAALGMNVQAFDPYLDNFGEAGRVENLEKLLKGSDVVSVHVPLTDDTRLMFGPTQFKAMKLGAIFINTARGGLVDHEALLVALDSGHLFGAGLDVTDPEPLPAGHPLLGRDDVVITPHVASGTREGKMRLFNLAFEQVLQVISGARPANLVNPEVWQ